MPSIEGVRTGEGVRASSGCARGDVPPASSWRASRAKWGAGRWPPAASARALALARRAERTAAPSWCEGGDVFPPTHFWVPPPPSHALWLSTQPVSHRPRSSALGSSVRVHPWKTEEASEQVSERCPAPAPPTVLSSLSTGGVSYAGMSRS